MADASAIARPYARAVFELARERSALAEWSSALNVAAAVVREPRAKRFLANPELDDAQRAGFVEVVSQDTPGGALWRSREGRNLLDVLAENDRLAVLPEIAAQFDELKTREENKVKVTIVSAAEVDRKVVEQIAAALQKKLGRNVELTLEIDKDILGGAIIRAEDMVIDGSVRTRLERLAEALVE